MNTCCETVNKTPGLNFPHFGACGKPSKVTVGDKHYCGIHNPARRAERDAKEMARYEAKAREHKRIAECVRALAGIESPEDFVREVREALENAEVWLANSMPVAEPNSTKPLPQIRRLLSLLNGERKEER